MSRPLFRLAPASVLVAGLLFARSAGAATITVNTLADPLGAPGGACTLRFAITAINSSLAQGGCPAGAAGDAIRFGVAGTIPLSAPLPAITKSLSIQGPGARDLAIDGVNRFSIFSISANSISVSISGLTLEYGLGSTLGGGALAIGAGVSIPATTVSVTNMEFVGNGAPFGGAIDLDGGVTLSVESSTFEGNFTPGFGGAIDAWNGTLIVTNSTLVGNGANSSNGGGAIYVGTNALVSVLHSTISQNFAGAPAAPGGGIKRAGGSIWIQNCIISHNATAAGIDRDVSGTVVSLGGNLVLDRGSSSGWIGSDLPNGTSPLLLPLAWNSPGTTRTSALAVGSPARDALAGCSGSTQLDQRGVPRPFGSGCDIGAFEWAIGPNEVSPTSVSPLLVRKGASPGQLHLEFADQPGTWGYNAYEGSLPIVSILPYTHANAPGNTCAISTSLIGDRRLSGPLGTTGDHYYLVTAFTSIEGPSGFDSNAQEVNPAQSTCSP